MIKNFLILFISLNIIVLPAYSIIDDEFVQRSLPKTLKIQNYEKLEIEDFFVEKTLNKNLKIKQVKNNNIVDEFALSNKNKNIYSKPKVDFSEQVIVSNKAIKPNVAVARFDDNSLPIQIAVKKSFSTKQKIDEGDYIEFETLSDVKIKNKTYPKGSTVMARVETLSLNKIWGVPSDLTVGNFSLDNNLLFGEINKTGANRSFWLYPTVYVTSCFFGIGLLLIPIRGGHAKIKPNQTYTVYYNN